MSLTEGPRLKLDPQQRGVLAACCVVAFAKLADPQAWMMGLDIPVSAFGAAWSDYRVFASINALVLIAFLLLGGVLGDALGRRRVMLFGVALATLANVLAFLAPAPPEFIVGRVLEAFGSALALPMTLGVIRLSFEGRARPLALLVYTFVTALGSLASLLALVLDDVLGWRATLVLPIAAGSIGVVLTLRFVPESRAGGAHSFRRGLAAATWSLVLLVATIGVIAMHQAGPNPITVTALVLSAAAALALVLSGRGRLRADHGLQLGPRQRFVFSTMLLAAAMLSMGLSGYLTQLYSFFTVVQGYGTIFGGLALAPIVLICVPVARPAARLAMQGNPRRLIAGGLALMGVALMGSALLRPGVAYWVLAIPMAVFGVGYLLGQTTWNNAFLSALPADLVGVSAGISKAVAQAGVVLGTSVLGTIVLNYGEADFTRRLSAVGLSSEQIAAATAAVDVVLQADFPLGSTGPSVITRTTLLQNGLMAAYNESFTVGLAAALLWAALACLGVAALTYWALRNVSAQSHHVRAGDEGLESLAPQAVE
jgi:MFS family permease